MADLEEYDYSFKIVVAGEPNVGKTNIVQRFAHNMFTEDSRPTLGMDFVIKDIMIGSKVVRCQVWDTAGQERMLSIAKIYYKNSNGVLFIFDITERSSFDRLDYWIKEMRSALEDSVPFVILGNKSDLSKDRKVTTEEAMNFAKQQGSYYIELSAKDPKNNEIDSAIESLLTRVVKSVENVNEKPIIRQSSFGKRAMKLSRSKMETGSKKCC